MATTPRGFASPSEGGPGSPAPPEAGGLGSPTAELRREHQLIQRGLLLLERAGRRLVAGRGVDETALTRLVDLIRRLVDRCHHGKEEGALFPAIRRKGLPPGDQLTRLLAEHAEGRDYFAAILGARSVSERAAAALLCVHVLREHMLQEERTLFPAADSLLGAPERAEVERQYRRIEAETLGELTPERIAAQFEALAPAFPE
jgi:hemerythrin-like domain-containing protein